MIFILNEEEISGQKGKIILESHIPEDEIEALAKCYLPDILDFFESEEIIQEFV